MGFQVHVKGSSTVEPGEHYVLTAAEVAGLPGGERLAEAEACREFYVLVHPTEFDETMENIGEVLEQAMASWKRPEIKIPAEDVMAPDFETFREGLEDSTTFGPLQKAWREFSPACKAALLKDWDRIRRFFGFGIEKGDCVCRHTYNTHLDEDHKAGPCRVLSCDCGRYKEKP